MRANRCFAIAVGAACAAVMLCLAGCGGQGEVGAEASAPDGGATVAGATPQTRISTVKTGAETPRPRRASERAAARAADGATSAPGAAAGKTAFTGRVTMADGSPLETTVTVMVTAYRGSIGMVSTDAPTTAVVDADGVYRIVIDPPLAAEIKVVGHRLLSMSASGTSGDGSRMASEPMPAVVVRDFAMQRGAELSGRLVDTEGNALRGQVSARWGGPTVQRSGQDMGKPVTSPGTMAPALADRGFTMFVRPGEVKLGATSDGFGMVRMNVTAPATGVEIRLGEGATIEGGVFMRGSGESVTSASVQLYPTEQSGDYLLPSGMMSLTDDLGAFRIRGVPDGSYSLTARKDKLLPWMSKGALRQLVVADGASTSGLALFVFPGYTVSGRVTEKDAGTPLEGVEIGVSGRKDSGAKSDADGRYRVEGVMGGDQAVLQVRKEGFRVAAGMGHPGMMNTSTLQFPVGEKTEVTKDFEMVRNLTISGRVQRANGDGIPGAKVSLMIPSGGMNAPPADAAADGSFKIEVAPDTVCTVKAHAPGYAPGHSEMVEVFDKPVADVVVTLGPGGTLGGVVVDPDGQPVAEATVNAMVMIRMGNMGMGEQVSDATTDATGRFVLRNVPTDGVTVWAKKKGFADSLRKQENVAENESRSDLRIELRKAHHVAGQVLDKDRKPVAGANVMLHDQRGSSGNAVSDVDGRYRVDDLAEATYQGYCHAPGQPRSVNKSDIQVDRDDVDFVFGETEKKDTVEVTCRVLDWQSRAPVKDFRVTPRYEGMDTDTGRPGEFKMRVQRNVHYTVTVAAADYVDCVREVVVEPGAGEGQKFEFLMGPGGTVTGRVVSKGDKSPLEGIRVTLEGSEERGFAHPAGGGGAKSAITAADGRFAFTGASIGWKQVRVRPTEGRAPAVKDVVLEHGKVSDAGDIEVGAGGTIRARVVRSPGDAPVPGVQVHIHAQMVAGAGMTQQQKRTDADGYAVFPNLQATSYGVSCSDPQMHTSVVLNGEATLDVVLRVGGGTLRGRVTLEGKPVTQGNVSLVRQGGEAGERTNFSAQLDGDGRYEITGLPEGSYRAIAYSYGSEGNPPRAEETLQIRGSGEQVHDFVLPSGRLVGRVVDGSDNPVPNAQITVSAANPQDAYARMLGGSRGFNSGDKGEFVVRGLSGGAYNITARKAGLGAAPLQTVEVPQDGESRQVTLKLEAGQTGTVVSTALNYTTAQPIPEAWCYLVAASGGRYEHGARRGPDGVMTISEVPAGRYRAEVGSWGFSTGTHDIEVKAGETVRVDDVLYSAGAVRWTLAGPDGAPVAGAQCNIRPDDPASIEAPQSGTTDPNGLWIARGLFPGSYTATATAPGRKPATTKMNIIAHEVIEVTTKME